MRKKDILLTYPIAIDLMNSTVTWTAVDLVIRVLSDLVFLKYLK